jgi:hypothetical protein
MSEPMPNLASVLASSAARLGRPRPEPTMPAPAKWKASLVSSQRGALVTRTAATREQAIAAAQSLLDCGGRFALVPRRADFRRG